MNQNVSGPMNPSVAGPTSQSVTGPIEGVDYRIPSLGYRILAGGLRLIPLMLLLVGLPAAILLYASSLGIPLPVSVLTVSVFGFALAVLGAARYVAKPTRAFGPISMMASSVAIAYLIVLFQSSPYRLTLPGSGTSFGVGYASLVLLLLIVPALSLFAGLVTTIEDACHPRERLPFDFPP